MFHEYRLSIQSKLLVCDKESKVQHFVTEMFDKMR